MGVVVSSQSATSPFFLSTGIIGIVSFAFTVGTFLRVVWVNLMTLSEAPHEVHTYLTNLRTELLEERANLRTMRKGMRKHRRQQADSQEGSPRIGLELDDVSLKTMGDVLRHLIKRFEALERPFLADGEHGIKDSAQNRKRARRRNSSVSPPQYEHAAYSSPPEKSRRGRRTNNEREYSDDERDDEDAYRAQRTQYANFTLRKRFIWLHTKADVQQILDSVMRLQIRRIALQVGGMSLLMHEYGSCTVELNEAVRRIDERVGRVVGVRRVD